MFKRSLITLFTAVCWLFLTGTVYAIPLPPTGTITTENAFLIGENADDQIGSEGITALPNGNIVIASPSWNGGRGAVTCLTPAEYTSGTPVVISESNSLVGSSATDRVGTSGVSVLKNGNYIVKSADWDNGATQDVGAVTWVNGATCIPFGESSRGTVVSASNSLIGSQTSDRVGRLTIVLSNGNFVVQSSFWDNGAITNAGAFTWGDGLIGIAGEVSPSNSLVGSSPSDQLGGIVSTALTNGNYVISSPTWDNPVTSITDAGMVMWVDGKTGKIGEINPNQTLVGSLQNDFAGTTITALANGSYVVAAIEWDNGVIANAGAVIWDDGISPLTKTINATTALVGTSTGDQVGRRITKLTDGGFVVGSFNWDNGAIINAGAATWGSGTAPIKGVISAANSLIGGQANDQVALGITALANGHYVVNSPYWDNGATPDVGAVTWGNKNGSRVGVVSAANSMIGASADDRITGNQPTVALTNGHYVIPSLVWDNGATENVGAVTWVNGFAPAVGVISAENSLIGSQTNDMVGLVKALANGNYVVTSTQWDNGVMTDVGAMTFADGSTGLVGIVSPANSMIGQSANDIDNVILTIPNGNYITIHASWDDPSGEINVGAIRWCDGLVGCAGTLDASNSLIGSTTSDISWLVHSIYPNGAVFISLYSWTNNGQDSAGALVYIDGAQPITGVISAANALVGTTTGDQIKVTILPNYGTIISAQGWDNGPTQNVGALVYVDAPVNRLQNPSLETAGSAVKYAANWKLNAGATAGDKRICSKPAKPITRTNGNCVFQFNSSNTPAKIRTLKQTFNLPDWTNVGDVLTLTADVEGLKVGTGAKKIILSIKYDNNTIDKATLTIPAGTYDYQTLVGKVNLTRPVKKIILTINVGKAKGRIRIDNMTLRDSAAPTLRFPMSEPTTRDGASTFELPAAPDGFRH